MGCAGSLFIREPHRVLVNQPSNFDQFEVFMGLFKKIATDYHTKHVFKEHIDALKWDVIDWVTLGDVFCSLEMNLGKAYLSTIGISDFSKSSYYLSHAQKVRLSDFLVEDRVEDFSKRDSKIRFLGGNLVKVLCVAACFSGTSAYSQRVIEQSGNVLNRGVHTLSDASTYEGAMLNGEPHGQGVITYPNGDKYDGEWKNGRQHGKGRYEFENGNYNYGNWINGELDRTQAYQGKDTIRGCTYEGAMLDEEPHGQGVFTCPNVDKYEGEWINGKQHGRGVLTTIYGKKYDGMWKDGKQHGIGTIIKRGGIKYTGNWINGELVELITDTRSKSFFPDVASIFWTSMGIAFAVVVGVFRISEYCRHVDAKREQEKERELKAERAERAKRAEDLKLARLKEYVESKESRAARSEKFAELQRLREAEQAKKATQAEAAKQERWLEFTRINFENVRDVIPKILDMFRSKNLVESKKQVQVGLAWNYSNEHNMHSKLLKMFHDIETSGLSSLSSNLQIVQDFLHKEKELSNRYESLIRSLGDDSEGKKVILDLKDKITDIQNCLQWVEKGGDKPAILLAPAVEIHLKRAAGLEMQSTPEKVAVLDIKPESELEPEPESEAGLDGMAVTNLYRVFNQAVFDLGMGLVASQKEIDQHSADLASLFDGDVSEYRKRAIDSFKETIMATVTDTAGCDEWIEFLETKDSVQDIDTDVNKIFPELKKSILNYLRTKKEVVELSDFILSKRKNVEAKVDLSSYDGKSWFVCMPLHGKKAIVCDYSLINQMSDSDVLRDLKLVSKGFCGPKNKLGLKKDSKYPKNFHVKSLGREGNERSVSGEIIKETDNEVIIKLFPRNRELKREIHA